MSVPTSILILGDLNVEVTRRPGRTVRIVIDAPGGRVRVLAPPVMSDAAIGDILTRRLGWITKQRERMAARACPPRPEFVEGEALRLLGQSRVLTLREGARKTAFRLLAGGDQVELALRKGSDRAGIESALDAWYRDELKRRIPALVAAWEPVLGVRVGEWGLKRMKSRWGSCNPRASRIWLNVELATRRPECLEYVLVHEMAHLLEPGHGPRFKAILDGALPDWRATKKLLDSEALPLA